LEVETFKKAVLNSELDLAIGKIKNHTRIIEEFKKKDFGNDGIETIIEVLDQNYVSENEWAKVILHFDLLNENFTKKLLIKHPTLTPKEVRLMVLVKLGYSNKGIVEINNITDNGVKKAKQRLLKKLDIDSFSQLSVN
jgi:DNA-binding CsgD family transcriptional regulator